MNSIVGAEMTRAFISFLDEFKTRPADAFPSQKALLNRLAPIALTKTQGQQTIIDGNPYIRIGPASGMLIIANPALILNDGAIGHNPIANKAIAMPGCCTNQHNSPYYSDVHLTPPGG